MIGDARATVAGILTPLGVPVHTYPTQALVPPAAVIVPGPDYLAGYTLGGSFSVGLAVQIVTMNYAHETLDALIWQALGLLAAAGFQPGTVPAPVLDVDTYTLRARIPVTLDWT